MAANNRDLKRYEAGPVNIRNKEHQAFINQQKTTYGLARDQSLQEGRENERALCSQLILVDTVLLTASLFALGNSDLFPKITYDQRYLILTVVVALVGSIISGIAYYFVLMNYYNNWAAAQQELVVYFGDVSFKTFGEARNMVEAVFSDIKTKPNRTLLCLQIGLLGIAFVAYIALLVAIFFSFHGITQYLPMRLQ